MGIVYPYDPFNTTKENEMDFNKVRKLAIMLASNPNLSKGVRMALNSALTKAPMYISGADTNGEGERLLNLMLDISSRPQQFA